ncbi:MAG: hypothetical protein ACR2QE_15835 [Acidimicrobiales bacterium]
MVSGSRAVVYRAGSGRDALGGLLIWADRHGVDDVAVLVDEHAGDLARRVAALDAPISTWQRNRSEAVPADVEPLELEAEPPAGIDEFVEIIEHHGLEVVAEHGVVTAELSGLEVARIESDGTVAHMTVGVGRFDREAGAMLRHGDDLGDRLADALLEVGPHRRAGAEPHPVNRLGRERWLRAGALDDPGSVGLTSLAPVSPAYPRPNLRAPSVAPAVGPDTEGVPTLVIFTVGVDIDVVPHAADLVAREGAEQVVLAGLARDQLDPIRRLAERLPVPHRFVAVDQPWPR